MGRRAGEILQLDGVHRGPGGAGQGLLDALGPVARHEQEADRLSGVHHRHDVVETAVDEVEAEQHVVAGTTGQRIVAAPADVRRVSAADKLHNATTLARDLELHGPATLDRFRGGRDGTLWYHREVTEAEAAYEGAGAKIEEAARLVREIHTGEWSDETFMQEVLHPDAVPFIDGDRHKTRKRLLVAAFTRDAIDTVLQRGETTFVLVDTAGLRRRRKQRQGIEYYSELRALQAAERADVQAAPLTSPALAWVEQASGRMKALGPPEGDTAKQAAYRKSLSDMVHTADLRLKNLRQFEGW